VLTRVKCSPEAHCSSFLTQDEPGQTGSTRLLTDKCAVPGQESGCREDQGGAEEVQHLGNSCERRRKASCFFFANI
jgi:hypothetical protein